MTHQKKKIGMQHYAIVTNENEMIRRTLTLKQYLQPWRESKYQEHKQLQLTNTTTCN